MADETAVDTTLAAAPESTVTTTVTTPTEDPEARIAKLEEEKAKLMEEGANWKVAALKYKKEAKGQPLEDESEEDKMRRIAAEALRDSRLAEIAIEQDDLIKKTLKRNKELELALQNKTTTAPAAALGSHSEGQSVKDTTVTPEQIAAFKARGWSEKDIERYKKNLRRYA